MGLLMLLGGERQVRLDYRYRHDVKDAAGVRVFGIGQFLVTSTPVIGRLYLAVDLTAVGTFQVNRVLAMVVRMTGSADFSSVTCLIYRASSSVMSNLARISAIMSWTETFLGGGPVPILPLLGLSFTGPALVVTP